MRLIDADYLKKMFDVACGTNREVFNIADSVYNFAIKTIDDAPTVERPTGHWKNAYADGFLCSECFMHKNNCTNFCPNCGADMRGGRE